MYIVIRTLSETDNFVVMDSILLLIIPMVPTHYHFQSPTRLTEMIMTWVAWEIIESKFPRS